MTKWTEYALKALQKKCYAPAHKYTYPLISLQTELSELNDALRKLADRVKHGVPGSHPELVTAARDELGDVIWAYTSLAWVMNWTDEASLQRYNGVTGSLQRFWNTTFDKLEEEAVIASTAVPCKLKTAVPTIYTQLNPIADHLCKMLRSGKDQIEGFPDAKVNEKLIIIGETLVRIAKALGTGLNAVMQSQLDKMQTRENEGKFVVLTSTKAK